MRVLVALLLLATLVLAGTLQFGPGGRRAVAELEARIDEQRARLDELAERNAALTAEVRDLKAGREAIEIIAREELGLIRKGEHYIQLFGPEAAKPARTAVPAAPVPPPLTRPESGEAEATLDGDDAPPPPIRRSESR